MVLTHLYILSHIFISVQAKVWDISRCLLLTTLTGHNAAIFAVDMSEDGSLVITGSADRVREGETGLLGEIVDTPLKCVYICIPYM